MTHLLPRAFVYTGFVLYLQCAHHRDLLLRFTFVVRLAALSRILRCRTFILFCTALLRYLHSYIPIHCADPDTLLPFSTLRCVTYHLRSCDTFILPVPPPRPLRTRCTFLLPFPSLPLHARHYAFALRSFCPFCIAFAGLPLRVLPHIRAAHFCFYRCCCAHACAYKRGATLRLPFVYWHLRFATARLLLRTRRFVRTRTARWFGVPWLLLAPAYAPPRIAVAHFAFIPPRVWALVILLRCCHISAFATT